jgi:hypothetical protein
MTLRRLMTWACLLLLDLLAWSSTQAQYLTLPARFDMGTALSPVASGYIPIDPGSTYSATNHYGWQAGQSLIAVDRVQAEPDLVHLLPTDLIRDAVQRTSGSMIFRVDLPPGTYHVNAYLGDLGRPTDVPPLLTPLAGMWIKANGQLVVQDAFARLQRRKASLTAAYGGYKRVTFLASPDATGTLLLTIRGSLMGLEFRVNEEPAIHFDHATSTLQASPGHAATLAPALALFNAHDYAGARTAFAGLTDPYEKAWGFAWLLGWLTNDEEPVDFDLITQTKPLLQSSTGTHPTADVLLAELEDFEAGALFLRTRGYSLHAFPDNPGSLGELLKNLCAGIEMLEQMQDDILLPSAEAWRPDCPLYAKAQYLAARAMYGRNVGVQGYDDVNVDYLAPYNTYWLNIFDRLWSRLDPAGATTIFPKAHEARVLAWYLRNYVNAFPNGNGDPTSPGPMKPWDEMPPPIDFANEDVWWEGSIAIPDALGAPLWAQYERKYAGLYRNLGKWWMTHRLLNGEIGGGAGDDTEGAGALGFPIIARAEKTAVQPEKGIGECMDKVLMNGNEVDWDQGYHISPIDPEHGGEYTSYPLFFLLPTYFGAPKYLEFGMRTLRNMDEPGPTAWTAIPSWTTNRHFKAFLLGANGFDPPNADITETMKAIAPGHTLLDYSGCPHLATLWGEYGRAWAAAAMSTTQGKPQGIFPVAINFDTGAFGNGLNWWEGVGQNGGDIGANYLDLFELLLGDYRRTSDFTFLAPIEAAVKFLRSTPPDPNATPGQPGWVADKLKDSIAAAAFRAKRFLLAAPEHTVTQAQIDGVINAYGNEVDKFLNGSTGSNTTDKTKLQNLFESDIQWLRNFWPLATTIVSYADRIAFSVSTVDGQGGGAMHGLYSTQTGAAPQLAPTFSVSWFNPHDAPSVSDELDFAIALTYTNPVAGVNQLALRALLVNFSSGSRDVGLRMWRDLPRGTYQVSVGKDVNQDDQIDTLTTSFNADVNGPAASIVLPQIPGSADGPYVVELVLLSPVISTCAMDLGIDPEDLTTNAAGKLDVRVHNVGAENYLAGGLIRIYDVTVNPSTTVASAGIPSVPAAIATLDPSSVLVPIDYVVPAGHVLRAKLVPPGGQCQITTNNDVADHQF